MVSWKPMLEGGDAERARRFVSAAAEQLSTTTITDPSVAFGLSGVALLHGFRAMVGEADAEPALDAMERALAHIEERSTPWLFVGYAGIGLAAQLLASVLGDQEELLADLDRLVYAPLDREQWNHEWELQIGLIGLGVYAATRGHDDRAQQVFRHLMSIAGTDADGTRWASHGIPGPPNFNLGMPHGAAGAVALLALLSRPDLREVRDALANAVTWLRAKERADRIPNFGQEVGAPTKRALAAPMNGWCYGDAMTALVLVRASAALDDAALRAAGLELALRDARRSSSDLDGCAIDETFCHGAIGRAHLFHELALELGEDELANAARTWYRIALDQPITGDPDAIGLQTGLAGRALAMLGAYSTIEPTWGRILLIR